MPIRKILFIIRPPSDMHRLSPINSHASGSCPTAPGPPPPAPRPSAPPPPGTSPPPPHLPAPAASTPPRRGAPGPPSRHGPPAGHAPPPGRAGTGRSSGPSTAGSGARGGPGPAWQVSHPGGPQGHGHVRDGTHRMSMGQPVSHARPARVCAPAAQRRRAFVPMLRQPGKDRLSNNR